MFETCGSGHKLKSMPRLFRRYCKEILDVKSGEISVGREGTGTNRQWCSKALVVFANCYIPQSLDRENGV